MRTPSSLVTTGYAVLVSCLPLLLSACLLLTISSVAKAEEQQARPIVSTCADVMSEEAACGCEGARPASCQGTQATVSVIRPDANDDDDRARQIGELNQQLRFERKRKDSLLRLYPDEARHNAARVHDLADKQQAISAAEDRLGALKRERLRLDRDIALYAPGRVPRELALLSGRNDTETLEAKTALANHVQEKALIAKTYDGELALLKKLWAAQRVTAVY